MHVQSGLGNQWQTVHSGSSYCSQSDLNLTFGLGHDAVAQTVTVDWPSGIKQRFTNVTVNQLLTIDEIKGVVK